MMFGNPTGEFACPEFVEAGINHLAGEIGRVKWNQDKETFDLPTGNNGTEYKTEAFEMRSYCWDEDSPQAELPNFKCGDLEVRWYKYCGRGMSMNRAIDANEFFALIDGCLASVRALDPALHY